MVRFADFVVAAAEREQFAGGLHELLEKAGEMHGDISEVVLSKVGIFDLIAVRRLHDYHELLGLRNFPLRFYFVAEQLLLHYGGRRYHSAAVAVITDLLSSNYNILSKNVLSELCADTRTSEPEEPGVPLDPSLPDIAGKKPTKVYLAGNYRLLLVENVGPIGARGSIRFRYVLAVCERGKRLPVCFVTLENSASISNVLCVFEADGSHSNYGALQDRDVLKAFMGKAIDLVRDRFDAGRIEELASPRPPKGLRWNFPRSGNIGWRWESGSAETRHAFRPRPPAARLASPPLAPGTGGATNLGSSLRIQRAIEKLVSPFPLQVS